MSHEICEMYCLCNEHMSFLNSYEVLYDTSNYLSNYAGCQVSSSLQTNLTITRNVTFMNLSKMSTYLGILY